MKEELHSRFIPESMTRDCLDPWVYVEFRVEGGVSLCCAREPIGNLAQQTLASILHSEEAIALRRNLLSGTPDTKCRQCGLRGVIDPSALQAKVKALRDSIVIPESFDPATYLESNPDVKAAGVDPKRHFLEWGRLEGRPLKPSQKKS